MKGSNKRILVAPLNWGLGHASRCVPIIRHLLDLNVTPVIAGDGDSLTLLKTEFPSLEYCHLSDVQINYPKKGSYYLHFLLKFPQLLAQMKKEHDDLRMIIETHNIDAVISDNRYGLFSDNIPTVLITHQLRPQLGFLSPLISRYIKRLVLQFDHCWIPDYEGSASLAARLREHRALSRHRGSVQCDEYWRIEKAYPTSSKKCRFTLYSEQVLQPA